MESRACMNVECGAKAAIEWKKGWGLRSGGFANLCDKCGSAYEQLVYCETFHSKESGWRECSSCGKRLHCGCIASKSSLELLDSGGVECISCVKNAKLSSIPIDIQKESTQQSADKAVGLHAKSLTDENLNVHCTTTFGDVCEPRSTSTDTKMDDETVDKGKPTQLVKSADGNGPKEGMNESLEIIKREQPVLHLGELGSTSFLDLIQANIVGSSQMAKRDDNKVTVTDKEMYESLGHACLSITLGTSNPGHVAEACYTSGATNSALPLHGVVAEGREMSKVLSPFQQSHRSRHLLPKPPKTSPSAVSDTSKDMISQLRVARPPGEGRGRSQLLPRYWPRITDQELQQISGDSNSTIVPLFEKILSASDAGRIGRLVLPKACAEAYFPPISQPEGLPLKIQDAKGKDWVFQFRFWPNNNSRMYVLEGVTPCIQSMQLQAGDTVTFSRIDPEGKLVMGFRKASNSMAMQDAQASAMANGAFSKENFYSGVIENLPIISGYSGLLPSLKGGMDPHLSAFSDHLNSSEGDIGWLRTDKHGGRPNDGFLVPERKRTRNIGSKSKRLHIDTEDAMELKLTWEEAQDLLRPPPSVKPSIVVIEDHEFEEYEEPPVFGKRTIFTARLSGGQDQWAQCDNCYKWRRLPVDVLLPPKWTCTENSWDPRRSSCSVPDEMNSKELENLLRMNRDYKKRKLAGSHKPSPELEPSGLDALATAAVLDDDGNLATPSIATTTKHPRHRPGCTCIVCIQPPSGKGPKHKPTCTCNVCMTVKRRFKTLMMRKKKRQSEREAETAQKKHTWSKDDLEVDSSLRRLLSHDPSERDAVQSNDSEPSGQAKVVTEGKGHIDLNFHPDREDEAGPARVSMMGLLQVANQPLETYLKQNGLTSLVCEPQASSSSHALPQATAGESEGRPPDDGYIASVVRERETTGDDGYSGAADQARNGHV